MYIFDMLSTKAVRHEERELPHPLSGTNPSNTHIYTKQFFATLLQLLWITIQMFSDGSSIMRRLLLLLDIVNAFRFGFR